jgi:hypothetical protein
VTPTAYASGYTSVTTKFDTGREQFTAFYPCAAFASDCILTAHLYYAWGMHGILPGARDSLFSVQVRSPTSHSCSPASQRLCHFYSHVESVCLHIPGSPWKQRPCRIPLQFPWLAVPE